MTHQTHFLVISQIHDTRTVHLVQQMRKSVVRNHPGRIKIPGIKEPYVTLVPPFIAEDTQARFFNLGVRTVAKIHEHGQSRMVAKLGSLGFFENPDEDAFFYRIIYPHQFNLMIEALREEIGTITRFAHEPKGKRFTPHLTICTGERLKALLEKETALHEKGSGHFIDEPISIPELYMRTPGNPWTPFVTDRGA